MAKIGIGLLGGFLLVVLGRALKPAMDSLFAIMNTTYTLTTTEGTAWRFMPYIIPAILLGILIAYVTGKLGSGKGEE